ncbi:MAG: hypothetical protein EBS73_13310 [Betaproteobacteria bacterium]|nr:hypothetical protein [Betaproteobacteria bacterium]NBS40225.1 hypothetical protein [Betaproteobacteria bacterium]NCY07871.1 hypothetical protein [Betaproteobacteria bacterium]NDC03728.1 hypothetical protein [Betaproteobacteria bacterium]
MANPTVPGALQAALALDTPDIDNLPPPTDSTEDLSGNDVLSGGDENDVIAAGPGDDLVEAGAGNDSLWGESGDDTLDGGEGSDAIYGGNGSDFLDGGAGDDLMSGEGGNDVLLGGDGDDELFGGLSRDSLFGEGGNDTLSGGSDKDYLDGGDGEDVLVGGDGDDSLRGGSGADALEGGSGNDLLSGDDQDDFLDGDSGDDTLLGGFGADLLIGGTGADSLLGEAGDDQLDGGEGDDTLSGGGGDDLINGGPGFDTVNYAGSRKDYTLSVFGNETVVASESNGLDVLRGVEKLRFSDGFEQFLGDKPWVLLSEPNFDAPKVSVETSVVLEFSEPIVSGTGKLVVYNETTGITTEYSVRDNPVISIAGKVVTFKPPLPLNIFTDYRIELTADAVRNSSNLENYAATVSSFKTATVDGLYHFFVVAFSAAPGAIYMSQLGEAYDYFKQENPSDPLKPIVDIFTTKPQFTDVYPESLSTRQFATQLIANVVKESATPQAKANAVADVEAAIGIGWTRGDVIYRVFGNLANKPLQDPEWGNTAMQFRNQLEVARYLTETIGYATEDIAALRQSIANVSNFSDISTVENIIELIGNLPPGI